MELVARFSDDPEQRVRQGTPAVLKNPHVSLLKQLAKSTPNMDIRIQVRDGVVALISHVVVDFTL